MVTFKQTLLKVICFTSKLDKNKKCTKRWSVKIKIETNRKINGNVIK